MSDKIDLIYDLLKSDREDSAEFRKEVREAQNSMSGKLTEIQVETSERLSKIEALDEIQNKHLSEHMRRTNILEDLHRNNTIRISKLEEPRIVLSTLKKWFVGIIAISAAIVGIAKNIGLF